MYMLTYVMLITVTCSEIAVVVKMKSISYLLWTQILLVNPNFSLTVMREITHTSGILSLKKVWVIEYKTKADNMK